MLLIFLNGSLYGSKKCSAIQKKCIHCAHRSKVLSHCMSLNIEILLFWIGAKRKSSLHKVSTLPIVHCDFSLSSKDYICATDVPMCGEFALFPLHVSLHSFHLIHFHSLYSASFSIFNSTSQVSIENPLFFYSLTFFIEYFVLLFSYSSCCDSG